VVAGVRRRLGPDDRRAEIVAAALRIFAERDPSLVPMEELAAAAGASPALIYHYFGDKAGLAQHALSAVADELIDRLRPDSEQPAVLQLAEGLATYLDYLQARPASYAALLRASFAGEPDVVRLARRVDDHVVSVAARALHAVPMPAMLDVAVRGWLEIVKSSCLRWLSSGDPPRSQLEGFLAQAFIACVVAAASVDERCRPAADRLSSGR
jgi:AcrR family transcriptional regulator